MTDTVPTWPISTAPSPTWRECPGTLRRWARAHALELGLAAAPTLALIAGYTYARAFYLVLGVRPWDTGLSLVDIAPSIALSTLSTLLGSLSGGLLGSIVATLVARAVAVFRWTIVRWSVPTLGIVALEAVVILVLRHQPKSHSVEGHDLQLILAVGTMAAAPWSYYVCLRRIVGLSDATREVGQTLAALLAGFVVLALPGLWWFVTPTNAAREVLAGHKSSGQPLPFGFGPPVRFVHVVPLNSQVAELAHAACVLSVGRGPAGHVLIVGDVNQSRVIFIDPQVAALESGPACDLDFPAGNS